MKTKLLFLLIIIASWSCSSSYESESAQDAVYEETVAEMDEPSSYMSDKSDQMMAPEELKSKTTSTKKPQFKEQTSSLTDTLYLQNVRLSKKFIKTANLRFKVKDVEKSTQIIEKLALKLGGYIHKSQINSNTVSRKNIEVSNDTILEILEYYIDNQMTIRVPSEHFANVLTEIGLQHIYINHREVKTEDVSTIFLRNKLKEEKRTEYEKRIQKAVDKAPRKLDDIVLAERQASELADIAIDKKIENYQLQDKIDYSTIVLDFYQSNAIHKEFVENTMLSEYQVSFWQKAWKAIQVGWAAVLEVIIGLLYLWPLYFLAAIAYYVVKIIREKLKK